MVDEARVLVLRARQESEGGAQLPPVVLLSDVGYVVLSPC